MRGTIGDVTRERALAGAFAATVALLVAGRMVAGPFDPGAVPALVPWLGGVVVVAALSGIALLDAAGATRSGRR